ncbi:glycosyltransferase family 4 protein [Escherichia coli]|uniref:glycosyltransferase family 4 protein n=2 Tax=Escherichia coli TaxID=562 RepID=UPI000B7F8662|nr:glycosyltransferase family 4 protein [Escherichia coli]EFD1021143.1 glycosyltransferase [Escherichia coli]EGI6705131.1 glycosyltransferase [Escherichia coli]EIE9541688.1 glycosyltransferase [Escherichia coli]ELK7654141.1 glycosyltransferase [Escherichia coli]MBE9775217.1 glycosyltransferase [Escherichia coli]
MKKILVITPRFPYPVVGGDRLRIYEICKVLAKYYSVTLVSLCENYLEMNYIVPDDKVFSSVHRVYLPKWKSYLNCLLSLSSSKPLQVAYYQSKQLKKLVESMSESHDLVLTHLIRTAEYAKNLNVKKILEMTDAISMNYSRISLLNNNAGLKGFIYHIERNRLNKYEKKIARYFDCNVLVSSIDRDFLYANSNLDLCNTLVCSNGVDLSKFSYEFIPNGKKLVFIGNMYSAQNFDAAYWFAKNVLPIIRQYDNYEFHVIGKIPTDGSRKLTRIPGVVVTGAVENVGEIARGALAGICSVRLAAGVQNKILEYMALGIPTITSSTGLEGLFAEENVSVLVANKIDEYVNHILMLKKNANFAEMIARNAFCYVKEHHSWDEKLKPLINKIDEILK